MKKRTNLKFLSLFLVIVFLVHLIPNVNAIDAVGSLDTDSADLVTIDQLTANTQVLNYVDESVFASNNHVRRLEDEETLSSYVFLNSDGTKTVYYTYQEVKYLAPDGTIVEKDISLVNTTNGYETASNDVELSLPNDPANGIGISYLGYDITLTPQGGMMRSPAQNNGTAIFYPDYFGIGASLMYTPTLSGVKEDIVLAHYTGINTFSFRLETDGLNLYLENNRYYLAVSEDADMRIDMGDIVSFDAHGRFDIGTLAVETITEGDEYILTLTVDEAFLTDENTTYPVSIDPTLTVSDNTHGAGAIEDVTIYSGTPNANGNWTYSHCGYYNSTYKVARTLVRLSGLYNDNTYRGASPAAITSAKFHIREASGTSGQQIELYQNTGDSTWTETGATWTNAGHVMKPGDPSSTATAVSNTDTVFDITSLLKYWKVVPLSNTYAGFILKSTNETSKDKAFYSSEYSTISYRPYVEVTYNQSSGYLPTSGYEKAFNPAQWEGYTDCIELMCNCYGYALNNQVHPDYGNNIWMNQQPGAYHSLSYTLTTEENIFAEVEDDYNKFRENFNKPDNCTIVRIGQYATCPAGMYKVALVMTASGEYHWYRQDSSGKWSHKNGPTTATNLDDANNEILDPWTANRGDYVNFLGYYAVYPWDRLWSYTTSPVCYVTPFEYAVPFNDAVDYWSINNPSTTLHCLE